MWQDGFPSAEFHGTLGLLGPEGTAALLRITHQLSSADISGDPSHEDAATVTLQSRTFVAIPYILAACVSLAE